MGPAPSRPTPPRTSLRPPSIDNNTKCVVGIKRHLQGFLDRGFM